MVYVQYKDRPDVCGTAFARSWEELSRVIDKIFGDPCLCRIAPHEAFNLTPLNANGFFEMDWDYVRSHNKPPVHLEKIFRLSGDISKI